MWGEQARDRYKNMQFGEVIDGEYIEYEDMTEDQLMDLFEEDYEREFRFDDEYFGGEYFEDDCDDSE